MIQYLTIMFASQKAKMDERGASAVEYGLLVAGIAVAIIAAVWAFGDTLSDLFQGTSDDIAERTGNGGAP